MRAKCPFCFVVAIAIVALGSFVTDAVAGDEPQVGDLVPQVDPNEAPFAVMWGNRVPGPMEVESPGDDLIVMTAPPNEGSSFEPQGSLRNGIPSTDPQGSLGIPQARGAGASISDLQEAKRSLKQLIRQLG